MAQSIKNLEGWQKSQNGNIKDVSKKLDKLIFWGMTASIVFAAGLLANIVLLTLR